MKKIVSLCICLVLILTLGLTACGEKKQTLNILNWGDYIDPALIEQFEDTYNVKVKYSTLTSNEEMLIKLRASDCVYDLCFPSDYIIEKLISEDLLAPLNMDNIPNSVNLDADILATTASFDPGNTYSLPYMWGTVGILYNKTMVSEQVDSWDILWDTNYAGQVLMYDSVRDTIGLSLIRLGYDLNTRSEEEVGKAADELIWQKQNVAQGYGTDDIKEAMINGRAALGVMYSGDALYCISENSDLAYALPKEGSNVWFDNVVIPKTSKNQKLAETFINFLCDAEVAKQNTEYIYYSSPNAAAMALLDESFTEDPTYNPSKETLARCVVFHDLGEFITVFNDAWERVLQS